MGSIRLHMGAISDGMEISGADFRYLRTVMRVSPGDSLLVFNEDDGEFEASISEVSKKSLSLILGRRMRGIDSSRLPDVELAFSPIRHARQDFMVEHATELGAIALSPIVMERSQVRDFNAERARSIAKEAAEQSGRLSVPRIGEPVKFADFLGSFDFDSRSLVFLDERKSAEKHRMPPAPATLLIGPEGGFSPAEFAALEGSKAIGISLGPLVLRAETAALAALATFNAEAR
jgi:16S rRNA (uracil1498-N3)-methyltransferase